MMLVYARSGGVIARSRNLRGLLDRARRVPPVSARLERLHTSGLFSGAFRLQVRFSDGSIAVSPFDDWRVAADWIKSRRSWGRIGVEGLPEFVERVAA